jgi:hypothetical protein
MPKQQRMVRMQQQGQEAAMAALQGRTDEELEAETRYRAVAQSILGQRAAERMDAKKARAHFQRAIAAAPPQSRVQIRRMADAALAVAERRPDDLKRATERLGVESPTRGQMFSLRVLSIIAPHSSAGTLARIRGAAILVIAIAAVLAIAFGIVSGIALAAGGTSLDHRIFYSIILIVVLLVAAFFWGRRRRRKAEADRAQKLGLNRS